MWELEFFNVSTGRSLGVVSYDGETMTVPAGLARMAQDLPPDDFFERYNGWSNGYVAARLPGQKRPRPTGGGVKMRSAESRDTAMKDHLETTQFFDEASGEFYEPKDVPADPTPDDEQ
jgi:hypothetical protein